MKKFLFLISLIFITQSLYGQSKDVELGSRNRVSLNRQGGFFDYSDPESINMRVSVWGFVRYPGKYLVPNYTTVSDLLSFAGGPMESSELENLRLYRVLEDSSQKMFKFNFDDILWENKLEERNRVVPRLIGGDILIVPGAPRLYFKEWFRVSLSIFSAIISLTLLIMRISRN